MPAKNPDLHGNAPDETAADTCVLFTARDAYLRDFDLIVPADWVAAVHPDHRRRPTWRAC
jgi:nicotinamidase-related amidase